MAKISEFTEVVQSIVKEGAQLREAAAKARPIPLMQERLSKRQARIRVNSMTPQDLLGMTPEGRTALLKEVGTDAVMGIIRKGAN